MIRTFVRLLIAVQFSLLAPRIVYSHGPKVQRPQARPDVWSVVGLTENGDHSVVGCKRRLRVR